MDFSFEVYFEAEAPYPFFGHIFSKYAPSLRFSEVIEVNEFKRQLAVMKFQVKYWFPKQCAQRRK